MCDFVVGLERRAVLSCRSQLPPIHPVSWNEESVSRRQASSLVPIRTPVSIQ